MSKYDGGPAFPAEGGADSGLHAHPGMSLRDVFASHALTGLIQGYAHAYGSPTGAPDEIVREAYSFADAMLAEREKGDADV